MKSDDRGPIRFVVVAPHRVANSLAELFDVICLGHDGRIHGACNITTLGSFFDNEKNLSHDSLPDLTLQMCETAG